MAKTNFNVTGWKELNKKLKKFEARDAKKIVRKALRKTAKVLVKASKEEAPVGETGRLIGSIKVKSGKRSRVIISVDAVMGKAIDEQAYYAPFVEFGTRFQEPQGYMQKAFDKVAPGEAQKLPIEIKKEIEKALKKK